jgi:HEPN domain-containing protein
MDANDKYEYWLDSAQYDLGTADAMFASGRWLYVVFTCQQALEKLLKGLYTLYIDDNVPKNHNLNFIIAKFKNKLSEPLSDELMDLFDKLSIFYLKGRYTDFKRRLSASVHQSDASDFLTKTKGAFTWHLTQKP